MALNIGEKIHDLVKKRGFKAGFVAKAINVSESSLYKIYKRAEIDDDKLFKLSELLGTQELHAFRLHQEPYKSLLEAKQLEYEHIISELKRQVEIKDKRIVELENLSTAQQQIIAVLQKKTP